MKKTLMAAALLATAALSGCDDNDPVATTPDPAGPTLADVVLGMFRDTSETALPVNINALDIDTSSEDPTLYNSLFI